MPNQEPHDGGQAGADIDVTPELIEAGRLAYRQWEDETCWNDGGEPIALESDVQDLVRRLFLAMLSRSLSKSSVSS